MFPLLHCTVQALLSAQEKKLVALNYVPLGFQTFHIRLLSDASFQNLHEKHSQIGFVVALSDKYNNIIITHWHSSRTSRRSRSTEESELLALDLALNRMRIHRETISQLLKKEVPTVVYLDNRTLWHHLRDTTVTCLPEVLFRCREHITEETVNSIRLIDNEHNLADAMTKLKPNNSLELCICDNFYEVPVKRVFML